MQTLFSFYRKDNVFMDMKIYKAACYCRLSQDDLNDGTSVSITTQMAVAREYCKEIGFRLLISIVMTAIQAQTSTDPNSSV